MAVEHKGQRRRNHILSQVFSYVLPLGYLFILTHRQLLLKYQGRLGWQPVSVAVYSELKTMEKVKENHCTIFPIGHGIIRVCIFLCGAILLIFFLYHLNLTDLELV